MKPGADGPPEDRPLLSAIGYVRVPMMLGEKISPEIQMDAISACATRKGYYIPEGEWPYGGWIIELDVTGRNFNRDITKAIAAIEHGKARAIIVWEFSRFGRDHEGTRSTSAASNRQATSCCQPPKTSIRERRPADWPAASTSSTCVAAGSRIPSSVTGRCSTRRTDQSVTSGTWPQTQARSSLTSTIAGCRRAASTSSRRSSTSAESGRAVMNRALIGYDTSSLAGQQITDAKLELVGDLVTCPVKSVCWCSASPGRGRRTMSCGATNQR
ncbi:recombinase family protein [Nonomuraea angiospora]|uniref:recombinase family protein n=1 Tax=Nonomuraea angiospora TaxID=46172 RepID=UPI00344D621B